MGTLRHEVEPPRPPEGTESSPRRRLVLATGLVVSLVVVTGAGASFLLVRSSRDVEVQAPARPSPDSAKPRRGVPTYTPLLDDLGSGTGVTFLRQGLTSEDLGEVRVSSAPPGAVVRYGGMPVGRAPFVLRLPPGPQNIVVHSHDAPVGTWTRREVFVEKGKVVDLHVRVP